MIYAKFYTKSKGCLEGINRKTSAEIKKII